MKLKKGSQSKVTEWVMITGCNATVFLINLKKISQLMLFDMKIEHTIVCL